MNASFNSTAAHAETEKALFGATGAREPSVLYGLAAFALTSFALATVILSGFKDGQKALQRIVWFFDRMLGGAPHTVTLPGPPGLPLVGNLIQVSF